MKGEPASIDETLLRTAIAGDRQALHTLLSAAQPSIRRYAQRSCGHADDVDDAIQETLILLYRRVGALRAIGAFSGWLLTIVKRECLRLARRGLGLRSADDVAQHEDSPMLAAKPADDLRLDLHAAIDSLPPHYREVLLLRDFLELTIDEIATELALTRESAKARLHRARAMVREYLLN
jgi:RNA polymerase sigma-70 factor (ECF subfamily)